MARPASQLSSLSRTARHSAILARLEAGRLGRAKILREACARACAAAAAREAEAAGALHDHDSLCAQALRAVYDGLAQRRIAAADLQVIRGQEDGLRRVHDALLAEQDAAHAAVAAADEALAQASAALLQATQRSLKRDRLADRSGTELRQAVDNAEEAMRVDDQSDRRDDDSRSASAPSP